MLFKTIKALVDEKIETAIFTKFVADSDLIDMARYMGERESIVTTLALIESSITRLGIESLAKNYGSKIQVLNLAENGLKDADIACINETNFPNLKVLCLRDNNLTATAIATLQQFSKLELDVSDNPGTVINRAKNTRF